MRTCINEKCVAFGRFVYSVATRCPLCRWDLRTTVPVSEAGPPSELSKQASASR